MVKDMTVGKPVRLMLAFAVPLLIGNIFQQFYSMVDAMIVGRFIDMQALAAVGATGSMSFLVLGFISGMTGGFSVVIAQRFGAGDYSEMRNAVALSCYLCVIMAVILSVGSALAARPILQLMDTPDDIIDGSFRYIVVIYAGSFAPIFYNMLSGVLRALGDSRTPLYFLIISSILNVILDFSFILFFHMGVEGAAYATVLSQFISGLLCLIYMFRKFPILRFEKQDWSWNGRSAWMLVKIGMPMALQFAITAVGVMVLQSAINSFGSETIAAYTAGSKVEQLATQPMLTLGITMATYTGQNLGAGQYDRIRSGVRQCSLLALLFSVIGALIVIPFGNILVQLFIDREYADAIGQACQYLNTIAVFFFVLGLLFIFRNVLQGIGDGFMPMMAGACELVVRVLVAFILAKFWGYAGICLAGPIAWIAATVPLIITYLLRIRKFKVQGLLQ
ncbi:MAG TPA: MATE family efflux transporter [Firmicutes bacterium]|nr:MATE family efflux transporter [Bacillota bacterium]